MFNKKSREDKEGFSITFFLNNQEFREYIPKEYSKIEFWLKDSYLTLLMRQQLRISTNFYYWHVRHMLLPRNRKTEDLQFLAHVYSDHDNRPTNRREKWFHKHVWSLYGEEFKHLIAPKIELEKDGDVPTHPYAIAYYKRWLRKPRPEMKKLYHGVNIDELGATLEELGKIVDVEKSKEYNVRNYQKRKLKQKPKK